MRSRTLTLTYSIRGHACEREHAVVVRMKRRRKGAWGSSSLWKTLHVELRRGSQRRTIPLHWLNSMHLENLSVDAERQSRYDAGLPTRPDAP